VEEEHARLGHKRVWAKVPLFAVLVALFVALGTLVDTPLPRIVWELTPPPLPAAVTDRDAGVTVTVTNQLKEPVATARVEVLSDLDERVYRAGGGRTNDKGVLRVLSLPRGHVWIVAEAQGYARASTSLVLAGQRDVALVLGPEHTFVVNVVDAEGHGIAGAEIEVTGVDPLPYGARADAQGRAEVGRLGEPPWVATARARGYDETTARGVRDGAAIKLVLHRLGSILVHVVDGNDAPVPNARVHIAGTALWPAREGKTGEHGMVKLAGLFSGSYALRATEGMRASAIEIGVMLGAGEDKELTLRLLPGRVIVAHVVDGGADDADDISGARVVLAESGISPFPLEAVTDKRGRATLGPIAPGPATLSARADGFVGRGAVNVPETLTTEVRVVLARAGVLTGRVIDARGFPIASATIEILGNDFSGGPIDDDPRRNDFRDSAFNATLAGPAQLVPAGDLGVVPGPVPPIPRGPVATSFAPATPHAPSEPWVSAGDGTFRAAPATPGRVHALVRHPEYVEGWSELVTIPPGGEAHIEVVLHAGGSLEGRVVDTQGNPVAGARIELFAVHGTLERSTKSASDGTFAFAAVPHDVSIDVYADEDATTPALRAQATVQDGQRREIVLTLPAARDAVVVRVKDDRGYPVGSAQVSVASLDPTQPLRETVFTSAEGEAKLAGAQGLSLRADVSAPALAPKRLTLDSAPSEVDVTLGRSVAVSGTVRSSRGSPIADAEVVLYMDEAVRHLRTDAQGGFAVGDLAPGEARLTAHAAGYAATEKRVTVPEFDGRPFSLGVIDLAIEGVVEGDVKDVHGAPVAGARVAKDRVPVFLATGGAPADVGTTDAHGHFRLSGLPEGTVTLEGYAPEIGRGQVEARVAAGRSTTNVRITLVSEGKTSDHVGATVAVTLGETGGEGPHDVVVVLVAEGSEAEQAGVLVGDVITDVDAAPVHTLEQAREKLSGPTGVDVVLGIRREVEGATGSLRLRVAREAVRR
jgi:Carboxypeptidase regulatory-like domain/PDZ domain